MTSSVEGESREIQNHGQSARAPELAEARTKVFQALRGLGFRETHVKAALERVREGKTAASGFEPLFRQALSVLVP